MPREPKIKVIYEGFAKVYIFKQKGNPKLQLSFTLEIEDSEEFKSSHKKKMERIENEKD